MRPRASVVRAEAVPAVELDGLGRELHRALAGEPRENGVERLLLADARLERLVAAEPRRDPERLTAVLAKPGERLDQEFLVRHRLADLHRRVPGGQHRKVVVVELVDRLRVMGLELVVRDLVDPRADDLAKELTTRLATDGLGHDTDRFLGLDEAERHREPLSPWESGDGTA